MSIITLDAKEREKFALYLKQEAVTDEGIAEQMEKLGGYKPMAKNMRMKALSRVIIANDLLRTEEMEI